MGQKVVCKICNNKNSQKIYDQKDTHILKCLNCGFIFRYPLLSRKNLQKLYDKDELLENKYFQGLKRNYKKSNPAVLMYEKELEKISKIIKPGKVLDIGCAYGVFLDIVRRKGWEPYGVEISKKSSKYAREKFNLDIFTGTLKEAKFPSNNFQLVTMWDVLEHLPNPDDTLEEIYRILKKDGLILILTINIDSIIGKTAHLTDKTKYYLYDLQHLNFYSEETLKKAIRKAGFKDIETINKIGAQVKRWQSRKIPLIFEIGTNFLDIIGKITGSEYRQVIIAKK